MIFVKVGLDVFVELTYDEAISFIDKKTTILLAQSETISKSAAKVKAHIKLVLEVRVVMHGIRK